MIRTQFAMVVSARHCSVYERSASTELRTPWPGAGVLQNDSEWTPREWLREGGVMQPLAAFYCKGLEGLL